MLQHYIDKLTIAIRQDPKIRKNAQLKGAKWTKSCFEVAADIISNELYRQFSPSDKQQMGSTISPKTLSNMFRGEYRLSYPIDPRTLNTLTKIARFLGHVSWEDFTESADAAQGQEVNADDPIRSAEFALREALALEFLLYFDLPALDPSKLTKLYVPDSPAFNRLMDNLLHFQSIGNHLSNPYNPSTYELLDINSMNTPTADRVRFRTNEYWLLCWWDYSEKRYTSRHKTIEEHFYTLLKTDEGWRVYANSTLADVTETDTVLMG